MFEHRFCVCEHPRPYRYFNDVMQIVKVQCEGCWLDMKPVRFGRSIAHLIGKPIAPLMEFNVDQELREILDRGQR